jgi:hypothetical protein
MVPVQHRFFTPSAARALSGMHRKGKPAETVENDPGCVKTQKATKCRKYSSLRRCRTPSAQHDLALMVGKFAEMFYARDGFWSFHTTKTPSRHLTGSKGGIHYGRRSRVGAGVTRLARDSTKAG